MSRPDLSPTALAELEIGSQQDHNARHERHTRMLDASFAPAGWATTAAICTVLAVGVFAWVWYLAGPPPFFNFFNR